MSYFADLPIWANAMIATFVVSLLPNVLLILMPESMFKNGKNSSKVKRSVNLGKMLLMFAVAGLLGDVFLHTLPHMLASHHHHHHHHHHAHENDGVARVLESSVHSSQSGFCDVHSDPHSCRLKDDDHNHHHHIDLEEHFHHDDKRHEHSHLDQHRHQHQEETHSDQNHQIEEGHNHHETPHGHDKLHYEEKIHTHDEHHHHGHHSDQKPLLEKEIWAPLLLLIGFLAFFLAEKTANAFLLTSHSHDHHHNDHSVLKAAGWLNLIADSLHNFTDGITIGAAFASGRGLGLAAFLSVVIHEVPHEISDFIILIRSGMTKWQAISAQFVTALAAFVGTALGLYLSENNEIVQTVLLAITGGGFVYIATVNVMPQIIATEDSDNEYLGLLQVIGEVLCFALGVGLMIAVAQLEEHEH